MVEPPDRPNSRRDLAALVGVAVLLVLVHVLVPWPVQNALAFDHGSIDPASLVTAAYVHLSNQHLMGNLGAYVIVVLFTYWISQWSDSVGWFRGAALVQFTVTPVLVHLTSWLVVASWYPGLNPTSRGFSSVVAGFVGVMIVALFVFVEEHMDHGIASVVGFSVVLLLVLLVDTRYSGRVRPIALAVALSGIGVTAATYLRRVDLGELPKRWEVPLSIVAAVVTIVGSIILSVMLGLFPPPEVLTRGGVFTNIYAHAAGVLWGIQTAVILKAA